MSNKNNFDRDYERGYRDGMRAVKDDDGAAAYYAGVGYGKKSEDVKDIGFSSPGERDSFERGMRNNDKHFQSYRARPLTWFERLFGKKLNRRKTIDARTQKTARQKVKRSKQKYKKTKKQGILHRYKSTGSTSKTSNMRNTSKMR